MSSHERAVATRIVQRLRDAGHEAYFVGGCVREMLLDREPEDYDVTTGATPDEVIALFPRVVEVGKQFGVVRVVDDGVVTEVATFRTDGSYTDGRRPDGVRFTTAAEDVSRRDFTINALLLDPLSGAIIDHVGGRSDLERRILRTVGIARDRMKEDRLRMLRAVRFTARLGFELHSATRAACVELSEHVASVSPERIREELSRMLADESRGTAIKLLTELRLLEHVLPEVHALHGVARAHCSCAGGDAFEHVLATVGRLRPGASCEAAWGALLHDVGLPLAASEAAEGATFVRHESEGATIARAMLKRLRMGNRETDRIVTLVRDHRIAREAPTWRLSKLRQVLAHPAFDDLMDLARAEGDPSDECTGGVAFLQDARLRWGTELPPPLLTGDDVLAAGVPRGPALGRVLDTIRAEQLDEQVATREQALLRARELAVDA